MKRPSRGHLSHPGLDRPGAWLSHSQWNSGRAEPYHRSVPNHPPAPTIHAYDPKTALIVVDVQNDFADPAGSLAVRGGESIIDLINAQVAAARAAGSVVCYTQDWHPASTPHFAKDGGIWPVHCVADTWGAQLHPALRRRGTRGAQRHRG